MPPVSEAQRRLMQGIAHGDIPAGHGRPSKAVAKEFAGADQGGKLPERKQDGRAKRRAVLYDNPRSKPA